MQGCPKVLLGFQPEILVPLVVEGLGEGVKGQGGEHPEDGQGHQELHQGEPGPTGRRAC